MDLPRRPAKLVDLAFGYELTHIRGSLPMDGPVPLQTPSLVHVMP